ncbi:DUF4105 domain-containing protein [Prolixibacter sp. SD074]|jgi:hypothetical protein|uniref:Lnb N-terminal periplasmic domain-containing protein n=1 Tax=Prolixibacter sp. SD074 TaxID=2652391 RepID=UPI00127566D5|nr:DUF4105 domain-containing protein [Prolixibacter sp. SD074]GET30826.1 membrane protein [Prolixibacter sp. SD074]
MSRKLLLLLLLFTLSVQSSRALQLSPTARISLLTCEPGNEIYSYFGHTALRLHDPGNKIDLVFNYGVFSFDAPNFVYRFAKGETDYMLAVQYFSDFMQEYIYYKRSVHEQEIDLTPDERQRLFDLLVENAKPENRVYRYNFFFDNCATRIRDRVEEVLHNKIIWAQETEKPVTFRDMLDRYVPGNTWAGVGIKMALGIPADKQITYYQKMFLPDYLSKDFSEAKVSRDSVDAQLCLPRTTVYNAPPQEFKPELWSPVNVIWAFFILVLIFTVWQYRKRKAGIWLDFIIYLLFGVAGFVLVFLTFVSTHPATGWNLNLVWALPTHFLFAFVLLIKPMREKLKGYHWFTAGLLVLFLLSMPLLPQTFHWLVIPLSLMLLLRSGKHVLDDLRLRENAQAR